jgi:hypothetical protein
MTRPSRSDDDHLPDHFLVDGVAPSVIGGGPPESPFDIQPDPEPDQRGRHHAPGPPPRGPAPRGPARYDQRQEPPTSPIPAVRPPEPRQEKKKSWFARVFRPPES